MGLPLFIAPVESDLPSKAADKSSATSPPRSSIRRNARPDYRAGSRAGSRRLFTLRDRVADGSLQQSGNLTSRDGRSLPWAEAGFPPDAETIRGPDGLRRPRPFRDVLREMTRSDDRRRDQLEEQINSLFRDGGSSRERDTSNSLPEDELDFGWWAIEARPRPTRTSLGPMASRQDPEEDEARLRRPSSFVQRYSVPPRPSALDEGGSQGASRSQHQYRRTRHPFDRPAVPSGRTRYSALQRSRGVDGLGDRDRSLSPEVWDTLLSTLTPDPQPPSAGSSFASNVASQSAGATSNTSFTAPDLAQETAADQACESGCEGSDTEGPDYPHSVLERIRRRREENDVRRVRVRVPDVGFDGLLDGGAGRDSGAVSSERSSLRQRRSPDGPAIAGNGNTELDRSTRNPYLRSRSAWVGHLSVGNSDDEQGSERRRPNRESSATSGSNAHAGEEDWMGMQRIVRSLARREDIPDEWWAEAGLSRTLPGDGTE
ncbi:hypothetical protein FSARC_1782 [Fusarium sarcochroum]|uniref:Uncharacterized protein n=1 Tax=Fusarium sarcochroum TaxID=1208366 RepID=A0A8H4U846_9HYPO|nr:hypothetical protein FSARC_1782 [Fusarium sarcochroum]